MCNLQPVYVFRSASERPDKNDTEGGGGGIQRMLEFRTWQYRHDRPREPDTGEGGGGGGGVRLFSGYDDRLRETGGGGGVPLFPDHGSTTELLSEYSDCSNSGYGSIDDWRREVGTGGGGGGVRLLPDLGSSIELRSECIDCLDSGYGSVDD